MTLGRASLSGVCLILTASLADTMPWRIISISFLITPRRAGEGFEACMRPGALVTAAFTSYPDLEKGQQATEIDGI